MAEQLAINGLPLIAYDVRPGIAASLSLSLSDEERLSHHPLPPPTQFLSHPFCAKFLKRKGVAGD